MTVPELRAECRRLGLPTYQVAGRRLVKADLVAQLVAHERQATPVVAHESPKVVDNVTDSMSTLRAKAERDLVLDYMTATKHASALGVSRDELLDQDAQTMHRILRGCSRPADERHWKTKEVIRGMVG